MRLLQGYAARVGISPKVFTFWGYPIQALASMFSDVDLSKYMWEKIRPLDTFPRTYITALLQRAGCNWYSGISEARRIQCALLASTLCDTQAALSDCRSIQTPTTLPGVEHVYYQYCIYTSDPGRTSLPGNTAGVDLETMHVDVCSGLPLFKAFAAVCPGAEETRAAQLRRTQGYVLSDVERVLHVMREVTRDLAPFVEPEPEVSRRTAAAV